MSRSAVVICFGDSLTAGFQSPTKDNPTGQDTPYGQFLQSDLGEAAQVRISGICGELTSEMVGRFQHDVLDYQPDYVAILGGTNDLGRNTEAPDIMGNLVKMYDQVLAQEGIPIPVTVPSIRAQDSASSPDAQAWIAHHLARRYQLNTFIQEHAASKRLAYVDLFMATVDPQSQQLAVIYSNDGTHLTTVGYQLFAAHVARVLKPFL